LTTKNVIVLGAGTIGSLITALLADSGEYTVYLASKNVSHAHKLVDQLCLPNVSVMQLDAQNQAAVTRLFSAQKFDAVISSLPYYCNNLIVDLAAKHNLNYFDLTEDVEVTNHVKEVANNKEQAFVPQCGLAPGFISIAANALMEEIEELEYVKMRVGALPINPNNTLKYSLTWSTDGLINEYGNLCYGIENGTTTTLLPLEGLETISLDGVLYEAFNTSGGLGTLAETYANKVNTMNYKTLRYPGHCEKIKFLMNDLKLNQDRDTLKKILENSIPKTQQDVVLVYVAVGGKKDGVLFEKNYVKKVYPATIANKLWSSIQITTAAGICSVIDIVLNNIDQYHGFITQESIALSAVVKNRFGKYYAD
jgi:saccharopine dehydrogenase-like NADP-dependent oxidoreductase